MNERPDDELKPFSGIEITVTGTKLHFYRATVHQLRHLLSLSSRQPSLHFSVGLCAVSILVTSVGALWTSSGGHWTTLIWSSAALTSLAMSIYSFINWHVERSQLKGEVAWILREIVGDNPAEIAQVVPDDLR
jgi:hypothetical protein